MNIQMQKNYCKFIFNCFRQGLKIEEDGVEIDEDQLKKNTAINSKLGK